MAVDGDAQRRKAVDDVHAAIEADQVVADQILGPLRPAAPLEIGFRRTSRQRQVGDLARDRGPAGPARPCAPRYRHRAAAGSRPGSRPRFRLRSPARPGAAWPGSAAAHRPKPPRSPRCGRCRRSARWRRWPAWRRRSPLRRPLRTLEQRRALFGQLIARASPSEQHDAERLLELGDVTAERRLAGREPARRGRKAAGLGDGDKAPDQVPVEIGHPAYSIMNIRDHCLADFHSPAREPSSSASNLENGDGS